VFLSFGIGGGGVLRLQGDTYGEVVLGANHAQL
jgi:hypothetical protein